MDIIGLISLITTITMIGVLIIIRLSDIEASLNKIVKHLEHSCDNCKDKGNSKEENLDKENI